VNLAVLWWNELTGAVTIRTRSVGSEVYSNVPGQRAGCEAKRSATCSPSAATVHALLVVIAVNEQVDRSVARMIILTGSESRHLFAVVVVPCRVLAAMQAWSDWR
jgi:hypothetical protein